MNWKHLRLCSYVHVFVSETTQEKNCLCFNATIINSTTRQPAVGRTMLTFSTKYKGICIEIRMEESATVAGGSSTENNMDSSANSDITQLWTSTHLEGIKEKVMHCRDVGCDGVTMVMDAVWDCIEKELLPLSHYSS